MIVRYKGYTFYLTLKEFKPVSWLLIKYFNSLQHLILDMFDLLEHVTHGLVLDFD